MLFGFRQLACDVIALSVYSSGVPMTKCGYLENYVFCATHVCSDISGRPMISHLSYLLQATTGECNVAKPGMLDMVGKAKWTAWNELGSMSKVRNYCLWIQS